MRLFVSVLACVASTQYLSTPYASTFSTCISAEAWQHVNALEMVFEDDTTESLDSKVMKWFNYL